MILKKPLDWIVQTQGFGSNVWIKYEGEWVNLYPSLGMKGHNGLDFRCNDDSFIYAAHDGLITTSKMGENTGNYIVLTNNEDKFETCYMHLKERFFEAGQRVKQGVAMGKSDNTGKASSGPHLHFGFRRLPYNQNNGYHGWEDPMPYLAQGFFNLPVDERYGKTKNWQAEWMLRFKNPWVHRRLLKYYKRNPLSLTSREINAILYGGWGFDEALSEVMINNVYFLIKAEYLNKKQPFCRLAIG